MRLQHALVTIILLAAIAACTPDAASTPTPFIPTATLSGGVVPTRVPATAQPTATLSPTPDRPMAEAIREIIVRSGPGSHYATLDSLTPQTVIEIIGISEDGAWFRIPSDSTQQRWITSSSAFITTTGPLNIVPLVTDLPPTPTAVATSTPIATPMVTTDQATTINPNNTYTGSITHETPSVAYSFQANKDDLISIHMKRTSGDLDPLFLLLDSNGREIARDDDGDPANDIDALMQNYIIPDTGTYIILATRFGGPDGTGTGSFTLDLTLTTASPTNEPAMNTATTLTFNEEVSGEINTQSYEAVFQFDAKAGDRITITMSAQSEDLDPLLILLAPDGEEINRNDDLGDFSKDASLAQISLPVDGTYTVIATRFKGKTGNSSGMFSLLLQYTDDDNAQQQDGNILRDAITEDTFAWIYTYEGVAGERLTLEMHADNSKLDSLLIIIDPEGREVARNDDYMRGSFDARIENLSLEQTGTYEIVATRYQQGRGSSLGTFELELLPNTGIQTNAYLAKPIMFNEPVVNSFFQEDEQFIYTFKGREGDVISLELKALHDTLDPILVLTDTYGTTIAGNDDFDETTRDAKIEDVTLPKDGYYTVIVETFNGIGDAELSITTPDQ